MRLVLFKIIYFFFTIVNFSLITHSCPLYIFLLGFNNFYQYIKIPYTFKGIIVFVIHILSQFAIWLLILLMVYFGFPDSSVGKESTCNAGDSGLIPGLGRSPGEGKDHPLQYSCLENPMDRGAWQATVHGVTQSRTWLKWLSSSSQLQTVSPVLPFLGAPRQALVLVFPLLLLSLDNP